MKRQFNRKVITMTTTAMLASMMLVVGAGAEAATTNVSTDAVSLESNAAVREPGALTSKPPEEIRAFSYPDMKYLTSGSNIINNLGNSRVELYGENITSTSVDVLGLDFTIQRWTGSTWVDSGNSSLTKQNSSYQSASSIFSVTPGYYYRNKCTHWITKGSFSEQTTGYSNSALIVN